VFLNTAPCVIPPSKFQLFRAWILGFLDSWILGFLDLVEHLFLLEGHFCEEKSMSFSHFREQELLFRIQQLLYDICAAPPQLNQLEQYIMG
jgi:hypothetical protein